MKLIEFIVNTLRQWGHTVTTSPTFITVDEWHFSNAEIADMQKETLSWAEICFNIQETING